ncbi:SDR family NAD(P)-dependent oxidoreductase, partial [Streptomyces mirabilis]
QVAALLDFAVERHGRLGIVVNNAGLGGTADLVDMADEQWDKVLDVTLNGTFRCTRAALRRMKAADAGGVVVNNASVIGWRAQKGRAHYAAAKAGVMALTRCAALEAAAYRVRGQRRFPEPGHAPAPAEGPLLHELERTGGRYGLQTMCEGGGQANVTIIERL